MRTVAGTASAISPTNGGSRKCVQSSATGSVWLMRSRAFILIILMTNKPSQPDPKNEVMSLSRSLREGGGTPQIQGTGIHIYICEMNVSAALCRSITLQEQ